MSLIQRACKAITDVVVNPSLSIIRCLPAVLPAAFLLTHAAPGVAQADALLPSPVQVVSTIQANGDVNPYGVSFVPEGFHTQGALAAGDLLVSNFNNAENLQGTGTTIVKIAPSGKQSLFLQSNSYHGLSTALNVLKSGVVMVGNVPTLDGTCATLGQGSLLFLNSNGQPIFDYKNAAYFTQPWDATVIDHGDRFTVFVSDAASGNVVRLKFAITHTGIEFEKGQVIASGYQHTCSPNFIIAQTGLAYDAERDTLYVASTMDNAIYAVKDASETTSDNGRGEVIYDDASRLHGPNGLILAPNGHLIAGNSDFVAADPNQPSEYVEFTTGGHLIKQLSIDPNFGGAFGLGAAVFCDTVRFAAVDDNAGTISIWTLPYTREH